MQDPRAKLSRDLVGLLADDYKPALDLLRRTYPPGLLQYLAQPLPRPPAAAPRHLPRPPIQVSGCRARWSIFRNICGIDIRMAVS